MWVAESDNLIYWGNHKHLAGLRDGMWDSGRMGGGAVPFRTEKAGWSSTTVQPWITATAWGPLLDLNDPSKVIARSSQPIMEPEADYEKNGFFGDVVSPAAHWSMAMS